MSSCVCVWAKQDPWRWGVQTKHWRQSSSPTILTTKLRNHPQSNHPLPWGSTWFDSKEALRGGFQMAFQMAIRLIDKSSGEPIPNDFTDVLHHLLFNESEIFMEDLWIFWWYLMIFVDINCRNLVAIGVIRCGVSSSAIWWFRGPSFPHAQNFNSLGFV